MNIYWEEEDYSGNDKKPKFNKQGSKVAETVDLSEAVKNGTTAGYATFQPMPPIVGGYDITGSNQVAGSIVFNFTKKPSWFHRTCCRFFLGWKWQDKKEEKKKEGLLLG
jgi:hypothetical protein